MHKIDLLNKLLAKLGVKSADQLDNTPMPDGSPTDFQTFREYERALSVDELTLEDIKKFCQQQLNIIEAKWANYNLEEEKKPKLLPYYTVYKTLLKAIESPKVAREAAEQSLLQILEK